MAKNWGNPSTQMGCGTSSPCRPSLLILFLYSLSWSETRLFSHCRYKHFVWAKRVLSAMRPEPSHSEWPVPSHDDKCPKNPWVTLKSTQNALFLNCFLLHTHTCDDACTGAQTGAADSVTGSPPMSGILTNIWGTYLLKICPRTHVAAAQCAQSLYMIQSGA